MKILVTGGAGYLGSMLVPDLLADGHEVTVLDSFLFRQASLNHVCHDPKFSVVRGDIRVEETMKGLLKKADAVIPLAALVGAPLCNQDPVGATTTNRDAILMMLRHLSILGILAAVAVPRFLNLGDDAIAASRAGVTGGLNSAVQMVHSRWLAQGGSGTVTPSGGTPITMNAAGYPDVGTTYASAATCSTLVASLLGGAPPSSAADCTGVTVPLRVGYSGGACQIHSCPKDFATPIALTPTRAQ